MAVIETLNASAPEKVAETVTVSMTRLFEKNRKLMLKTNVKPLFFSELHHLNKDGKAHETLQTILPATVNEGENISIAVDLGQLVDHQGLSLKVALDIYTYVYP